MSGSNGGRASTLRFSLVLQQLVDSTSGKAAPPSRLSHAAAAATATAAEDMPQPGSSSSSRPSARLSGSVFYSSPGDEGDSMEQDVDGLLLAQVWVAGWLGGQNMLHIWGYRRGKLITDAYIV